MKRIYITILVMVMVLSGCSASNPLLSAISQNYEMDEGKIKSSFIYNTTFDKLDLGGNIKGNILLTLGDEYDKLDVTTTYNDVDTNETFYIDEDDNALQLADKKVETALITPIFEKDPDLSDLTEMEVTPKTETVTALGKEYKADKYTLKFDEKIDTDFAKILFETIIDLGLVDVDNLQSEQINGDFNLVFYIDQESGRLVREEFNFTNENTDTEGTSVIRLTNEFSFEKEEFEVPSEILEAE